MPQTPAIEEQLAAPAAGTLGVLPKPAWLNAAPYLAIAALVCVFYWPLFVPSNAIVGHDYYDFNVPNRVYATNVLRSGRLPIWAPEIFGGFPFLADPQTGVFGPLNLLVAATIPNPGDSYFFQLFIVLHQVLIGFSGVFLARSVRISRTGALICGIICALNGYNTFHFLHSNLAPAIAAALFAVGCLIRALHQRDIRWSALSGIAIAAGLLSSHPQISIHMMYAVALTAAFLWVRHGGRIGRGRATLLCSIPLVIGILGAFAQILPSLDFYAATRRAVMPYEETLLGKLPLDELPLLLFPHLYRPFWWRQTSPLASWSHDYAWEYSFYVGLVAMILAIMAIAARPRRASVWMLVGAFVLGWIIALGDSTPVFKLVYQYVPWFKATRIPPRICWTANAALAVLAGMGVDAALSRSAISRRRALIAGLSACVAVSLVFAAVVLIAHQRDGTWTAAFMHLFARGSNSPAFSIPRPERFTADVTLQIGLAAAIAVLLSIWIAAGFRARRSALMTAAIVLLAFGELTLHGFRKNIAFGRGRLLTAATDWIEVVPKTSARSALAHAPTWPKNQALAAGQELAGGYGPLVLRNVNELLPAATLLYNSYENTLLDMWNVRTRIQQRRQLNCTNGLSVANLGYLEMGTTMPAVRAAGWDVTTSTRIRRVVLLSATGYTYTRPDNLEVGTINLLGRDGTATTLPIRLGRETAEWAYDSGVQPAKPAHQRPAVSAVLGRNPLYVLFLSTFDVPDTVTLARVTIDATGPPETRLYVWDVIFESADGQEVHFAPECFGYKPLESTSRWYAATARPDSPGYAWMVGEAEPVSYGGDYEFVRKRFASGFEVRRRVLVDDGEFTSAALEQMNAPAGAEFAGTASFERTKPELVRIRTDANARGWLVISHAYFSKWRAFVDGQRAPLVQADGAICAVPVPAGRHTVELRLVWPEVWVGIGVSVVAWACAIGMLLVKRR